MLRVASIGLGWWSDELAGAIRDSDRIRIVSCFSRSGDKREAFAGKFGTGTHDSFAAVLADPTVDGVLLTTPHSMHGDHVRQAAAAGKHAFVEKPFTLTYQDALAAIAACEAAGVVLAVGHNRRLAPATREIKRLVDEGALGTVLHGEAQFSLPGALNYKPGSGYWRASRAESPGGGLTGLGIHMIDQLVHLLGPIARVTAFSKRQAVEVDVDDTTVALLECANGRTGYLGCLFATQPTRFVNVYGTKAVAHAENDLSRLALRTGPGPLQPVLESPDGAGPVLVDTLRAELEAFADAVAGVAAYPILPMEAAHNVAVMEAIIASGAQGGAPVEVAGMA